MEIGCGSFRFRKGAAPLKPAAHSCGGVESYRLPLPKGSGPSETSPAASVYVVTVVLPLPKGSGPIEAQPSRPTSQPSRPTFRFRKGAAPLKREMLLFYLRAIVGAFRFRKGAAPLKPLDNSPEVLSTFSDLPLPKGSGPIEARDDRESRA